MTSDDKLFIKTSIIISEIIGGFIILYIIYYLIQMIKKCNKIEPFIERTVLI